MQIGQILRTRTGTAAESGDLWKAFDKPGGVAITAFAPQLTIGTFAAEEKMGVIGMRTTFYKIRLLEAVTYKGVSYQYVYMEEGKVFAYVAALKTYKARSTVNVRSSPSSASVSNKIGSLSAGAVAGTSDGTEKNGFLYVKLATPLKGYTYGFIAKTLLTAVVSPNPTPAPGVPPAVPGEPPVAPPLPDPDPTREEKAMGWLERTLGENGLKMARFASMAVAVVLVGYVVWNVAKKK